MGRVLWMGVGAVGGIYAYRKGERAYRAVQAQGLAGTTQILVTSTVSALASLRAVEGPSRVALPSGGHALDPSASSVASQPGLRIGVFHISRAADAPVSAPAAPAAAISDTSTVPGEQIGPSKRRKAR